MLWLAWIFEMETCMNFLIYKILFLLHSFTRNTLAAKSILSSPEKNKINYPCNLTKFQSTKKKKAYFFHSSKIKVLQSKKTRSMIMITVIIIKAKFYLFLSNQDFCNETKHYLGCWRTNGAGRVRRGRALPNSSGRVWLVGWGFAKGGNPWTR